MPLTFNEQFSIVAPVVLVLCLFFGNEDGRERKIKGLLCLFFFFLYLDGFGGKNV